jgi:hypothetical protein
MIRPALRVFVAPGCAGCCTALQLVDRVRRARPDQPVEVVDLADPASIAPPTVIGTPTYLLGEQVISLGNPALPQLLALLDTVVAGDSG